MKSKKIINGGKGRLQDIQIWGNAGEGGNNVEDWSLIRKMNQGIAVQE
jgi:hypothetical protein